MIALEEIAEKGGKRVKKWRIAHFVGNERIAEAFFVGNGIIIANKFVGNGITW